MQHSAVTVNRFLLLISSTLMYNNVTGKQGRGLEKRCVEWSKAVCVSISLRVDFLLPVCFRRCHESPRWWSRACSTWMMCCKNWSHCTDLWKIQAAPSCCRSWLLLLHSPTSPCLLRPRHSCMHWPPPMPTSPCLCMCVEWDRWVGHVYITMFVHACQMDRWIGHEYITMFVHVWCMGQMGRMCTSPCLCMCVKWDRWVGCVHDVCACLSIGTGGSDMCTSCLRMCQTGRVGRTCT